MMKERCTVITGGGYTAWIRADHGANCVKLMHAPSGADMLRTPPSDEIWRENANIYGMPFLFPPNRILDGQYTFRGRTYHFPINETARHHHMHGLLSVTPFETEHVTEDSACFVFRATREKPYLNFPHEFTVRLQYSVGEGGLSQTLTVVNDGREAMPFGAGFHTALNVPFLPGARAEDCVLRVTAGKIWKYDERIIPTGETLDAEEYRRGVPAAHRVISELMDMGKSGGTAVLEDQKQGGRIVYEAGEGYRYWMLFNHGGEKGYICPEPQTWIVDAPNRPFPPEVTGFDAIEPGDCRVLKANMRFEKL